MGLICDMLAEKVGPTLQNIFLNRDGLNLVGKSSAEPDTRQKGSTSEVGNCLFIDS